ncbi:hypothetical protein CASFOL_023482 [Castilleja foliolosa]|uniref:Phosphatidylinositol transfer protein N-terminal domain-containing protein n=1 Tax=Castilleja foliolosa TaxID=1961234 RepID=A0ABD3CLJ2_9LAMI
MGNKVEAESDGREMMISIGVSVLVSIMKISQKKDARVQLISFPKSRADTKVKAPTWLAKFAPAGALVMLEEVWNAYP